MIHPPELIDFTTARDDDEFVAIITDNTAKTGKIRRNLIWLQEWVNDYFDKLKGDL